MPLSRPYSAIPAPPAPPPALLQGYLGNLGPLRHRRLRPLGAPMGASSALTESSAFVLSVGKMRLVQYPFVVVRIRCDLCHRSGQSRLARLAAKFGPEATLDEVVERLTRDCPWRKDGAADLKGCGAFFPDLPQRTPPDLPPAFMKLKLVRS